MPTTGVNGSPSLNNTDEQEIVRPLADFPKDIWGDLFTEFTFDEQVYNMLLMEIAMLKKEVKSLFLATRDDVDVMEKLKLIDEIERLGISYHFKEEIEELLEQIFNSNTNSKTYLLYDLNTAALQFRLLRQHGLKISCGIFDNFMDTNGKLKESLFSDTKGLLSLYEAAQLRTKEDIILDDALACATANLKKAALPLTSALGKQVKRALEQSLWKGHQRTEARYYMSAYEEGTSGNETLLKLAKMDYKLLQMLHRKELCELVRWWRELNLASKLGYIRDRSVENYYWALGNYYEPEYSRSRIVVAKTAMLICVIDDTYDAYGTLDELQIFTDALQSWDRKEVDGLLDYMKPCYMALLDTSHEIEEELVGQEKSYAIHYYNEMWKEYARFTNIQEKWFNKKVLPTFDDYMKVGLITSCYNLLLASSLMLMKSASKEVFDWLATTPKIMVATMAIGRLLNDVASHLFEKERGAATALDCYIKHYNVSEEEAMVKVEEIIEEAWKDFNEEWIKPTTVPREILVRMLGLGQLADVCYKHDIDGFTDPVKLIKPHIIATLMDPIII